MQCDAEQGPCQSRIPPSTTFFLNPKYLYLHMVMKWQPPLLSVSRAQLHETLWE